MIRKYHNNTLQTNPRRFYRNDPLMALFNNYYIFTMVNVRCISRSDGLRIYLRDEN